MNRPAEPRSAFLDALGSEAQHWQAQGLARRRRTLQGPSGPYIEVEGQGRCLSFLSNDYLGLAADAGLIAAVAEGARRWGAGSGASALISGHMQCHRDAEAALAQFTGCDAALLFITGYMANLAVVTSLLNGADDAVFSDALNHASIVDACRLSRARIVRYRHLDLDELASQLRATPARRRLIVSDAVFSMDGDCADLAGLLRLAETHDALLLVDDAHGFGLQGPQGRGSAAQGGLASERLILMGTLGKAVGLSGAFVAASQLLVEHLVQHARTYVFSTAPAPALAAAIPTALDLVARSDDRRLRLTGLRAALVEVASQWKWQAQAGNTPIVPVILGEAKDTMLAAQALAAQGVLTAGVRPPTVPAGSSRLRFSLCARHTREDIRVLQAAATAAGFDRGAA